ncbi:hypothetical protein GCM10009609_36740 [Pseudonocardia aurantiaca]
MALPGQLLGQVPQRLSRPPQRRFRITPLVRLDQALAEIWNAEDKHHALDAVSSFKAAYGAKFGKAVAKITDDLEVLLAS